LVHVHLKNWETLFWPISLSLAWVADNIPSIAKMTAVSPIPGVVRGVLASMVVLAPIAGIVVLFNDCIDICVRELAAKRSAFKIAIAPFAWFPWVALLGFFFWFPFIEVKLSYTPTWGHALLTVMMTNHFVLAGGALFFGYALAITIYVFPINLLAFADLISRACSH
jgi:hypothetical protein